MDDITPNAIDELNSLHEDWRVQFNFDVFELLELVALVQLGLQHPKVTEDAANSGRKFIDATHQWFSGHPNIQALIDEGNIRPE